MGTKPGCTSRSATTERGCGPMPIFQLLHRSSSRLLVACDLLISPGGVSPCRSISSRTASPRVPSLNLSQLGASSSEATDNGHPPLLVRGAAELDMRDERPSIDLSDLSLLEESSDPVSHQPPTLRRRSARIDLSRPGGVSPCHSISTRTASPRVPSLNLSQLGASSSEATDNGHPLLLVRGAAELDMRDERPSI